MDDKSSYKTVDAKFQHTTPRRETHLPWTEKYRPSSLDAIIAQGDTLTTIRACMAAGELPHLMFYGPPGTGKTSTILAIARQLSTSSTGDFRRHVLELNASDDRNIGFIRDELKAFCGTQFVYTKQSADGAVSAATATATATSSVSGSSLVASNLTGNIDSGPSTAAACDETDQKQLNLGLKLVILDEADSLSSDAQMALRRLIEQYTRSTRFCLIANSIHHIIPALQSRCTRFRFAPLSAINIRMRMMNVATLEHLDLTDDGAKAIVRLAKGDMRKVLNILQTCALGETTIDESCVYRATGQPTPFEIANVFSMLLKGSLVESFLAVDRLLSGQGFALVDLIRQLYEHVMSVLLDTSRGASELSTVTNTARLLSGLADCEYRVASCLVTNSSDHAQLAGLVAVFYLARRRTDE